MKNIYNAALFVVTASASNLAVSYSLKNELVVDYIEYFEESENAIDSRELVQLRSSLEHKYGDRINAYVQVEAKQDFADEQYNNFRLREAYLEFSLANSDHRIGKHQVVWGKTDFLNPTDTITPVDYSDFYDTEDQRQPIELLHSRFFFNNAELETLMQFGFEATNLPKSESRWLLDLNYLIGVENAVVQINQSDEPDDDVSNLGLKQSFFLPSFDFSISYVYGWHPVSNADMTTQGSDTVIDYYFYKRHQLGADFAASLGQIGLRGEMAYVQVEKDSFEQSREGGYVQYALGIDKTFTNGVYGKDLYINLEILGDENTSTKSFGRIELFDPYDLAVGIKVELVVDYTLRFSVETIADTEKTNYRIRPKATYSPMDGMDIDFIVDIGDGEEGTLYGFFNDNDRYQMRLTYSF
ncbi:DUF1302 family protein [Teredinibacter sp. KSP-S5-2]|uniref:DUF1302 family protein n=1 Tax=Teredinibacter sp. KSP-S5-2 TaxID=3034506 RepID=UPI002934C340|nr:DUF1302 family protein [Teredinibacter sp. KSP-S5-2]WNO11454.1 hypothetical protein P5V12_09750 [Teredinibacter sp. KSP-S5-2]